MEQVKKHGNCGILGLTMKITILLLFTLFVFPPIADAALVDVAEDGEITLNVLSSVKSLGLDINDQSTLEINKVPTLEQSGDVITLTRDGEKVSLSVLAGNVVRELDVTSYTDNLVEFERKDPAKRVRISFSDGNFTIEQGGVTAKTSYSININTKEDRVTLDTSSGKEFLSVLPVEAIQSAIRARVISNLAGGDVEIAEGEGGSLNYLISGKKIVNIFNIIDFEFDVETTVSAATGEVVSIDSPTWLRGLAFLFV